jgi:hypothetical protein
MKNFKKSLLTMFPLILAPFTFFLFAPMEMVMRNTSVLWFTWQDVFPIIITAFLAAVLLFCLIGLVLPEKIRRYYIALIWGVGLALYAQGNLMPVDYGPLDGFPVDWEQFAVWAVINTVIWIVLIVAPVLAVRFWNNAALKAMQYITFAILTVQVATTTFLIATPAPRPEVPVIITTDNMFTVSDNQNIIIFVLDSFDTMYMEMLLEEEPELKELLEGFVFFDNTLGMFNYTFLSIPYLLTGIPFLNETTRPEYLDVAFSNAQIYPLLYGRNFSTNIFVSDMLVSSAIYQYVDNMMPHVEWRIGDILGMASSLHRISAIRYFPHILKESVWAYFSDFDAHRISEYGTGLPGFIDLDFYFYNALSEYGLIVNREENIFTFIHLFGPHLPVNYDRYVRPASADDGVTIIDNARGALRIALEYISQMKKLGVWDDTLMIITADHGCAAPFGMGNTRQRPVLLVREPGGYDPFSIDSRPISFADLMPMLKTYVTGQSSAINFLQNASLYNDERSFFWASMTNIARSESILTEYLFTNSSTDISDARFVRQIDPFFVFTPPTYNLGDTIYFGSDNRPQDFFRVGLLSVSGDYRTWSHGVRSVFSARLSEYPVSDMVLHVEFYVIVAGEEDYQDIRLYSGERLISEDRFYRRQNVHLLTAVVPKETITPDGVIELRFEYLTVIGEGFHNRNILFRSMRLTPVESE